MALFKAELVEKTTRLSPGKTYFAVKFNTGSCSFTMQMTDFQYCQLLHELAGDKEYDRPHDSELMKNFLSLVFEVKEDD